MEGGHGVPPAVKQLDPRDSAKLAPSHVLLTVPHPLPQVIPSPLWAFVPHIEPWTLLVSAAEMRRFSWMSGARLDTEMPGSRLVDEPAKREWSSPTKLLLHPSPCYPLFPEAGKGPWSPWCGTRGAREEADNLSSPSTFPQAPVSSATRASTARATPARPWTASTTPSALSAAPAVSVPASCLGEPNESRCPLCTPFYLPPPLPGLPFLAPPHCLAQPGLPPSGLSAWWGLGSGSLGCLGRQ